jgi:hypothetical protein
MKFWEDRTKWKDVKWKTKTKSEKSGRVTTLIVYKLVFFDPTL